MGATTFETTSEARGAKSAFKKAVKDAEHWYGHGGYTGTIAEKDSFVVIPLPPDRAGDPSAYAWELIDKGDQRVDDKWGPCGCIELPEKSENGLKRFLFFGWASS